MKNDEHNQNNRDQEATGRGETTSERIDSGGGGGNRRQNKGRGFASMDPRLQQQIASQGGRAAHEKGTAHEFTSEEAREAGRRGGLASRGNGATAGAGA